MWRKFHSTKSIVMIAVAIAVLNVVRTNIPTLRSTKRILSPGANSKGCIRNIPIDRFPQDELVPDDETSRQMITGTLMSECEAQMIKRFITSIAGVFCPKKIMQHLIFFSLKNREYLANIASSSWPIKKYGMEEK